MSEDHTSPMSRRGFLFSAGALGAAAWLSPRTLSGEALERLAQDGPVQQIRRSAATARITVQPLRGNLSFLSGSGGNVLAYAGRDGVVLVDSGVMGSRVAASVATFSRQPIRHVINTHWHFDHTDANAYYAGRGAAITAHENTRKHMSRATRVDDWNFTFPRAAAAAIPGTVFGNERSVRLHGANVAMKYYGPSHTDSDISVHFTDADVLHMGDNYWSDGYPFIDYSNGGSIDGTIRAVGQTLGMATARTIIVPGHGPVADRARLTRFRDMLVASRERVAALKRQGRTLPQVVAAKPTAAYDAVWGRAIVAPANFVGLVYRGV